MLISWILTFFLEISPTLPSNPLQGKHLRVFASEYNPYLILERNSSGHIVEASGGIIERWNWLSRCLQFTYNFAQLPRQISPDNSLKYILKRDVDCYVGVLVVTVNRNKLFDMPQPWLIDGANMIMPYPTQSPNTEAPLKPFTLEVWISLIAAALITIIAMYTLTLLHNYMFDVTPDRHFKSYYFGTVANSTDYVVAVLMGQGGVCYSQRFNTRLVAAAWCLAACVLVYAYSSILTSFVSAPNSEVLVNSLEEIIAKPNLKPVVVRGTAADLIIMNSESGLFRRFRNMLNQDSRLRCPNRETCLEMVRLGSRVYLEGYSILMSSINEDVKATGKCRYTVAKGGFSLTLVSFAVPKYSNYIENLNKGVIRMWDTGLINLWEKRTFPKPNACLNIRQRPADKPQLNLKNLSGPFVLLLIGYAISLFFFFVELLFKLCGFHLGKM